LDEGGYLIYIEQGSLKICDLNHHLLTKVQRTANQLYILELNVVQPVCYMSKSEETSWRWHAKYGHLNFPVLQRLSREAMVVGLPPIKGVDTLCDGFYINKQRHTPFPSWANYRAHEPLELVHGDLCGPIKLTTPGGKNLF
jgi:hypothetical protein